MAIKGLGELGDNIGSIEGGVALPGSSAVAIESAVIHGKVATDMILATGMEVPEQIKQAWGSAWENIKPYWEQALKLKDHGELLWYILYGLGASGAIGAVARRWFIKRQTKRFEKSIRTGDMRDFATITFTSFTQDGEMEIRNQVSGEGGMIFDIPQDIYRLIIKKVANTTPDKIILNLPEVESDKIYSKLRDSKHIGFMTDQAEIATLREFAKKEGIPEEDLILTQKYRAYMTREPQFHTDKKTGEVTINRKGQKADTKDEVRLMFFIQEDLDKLDRWIEENAGDYETSHQGLLEKICSDHINGSYTDDVIHSRILAHGKYGLTEPKDRKRIVAMAQAIRAYTYENNPGGMYEHRTRKPQIIRV